MVLLFQNVRTCVYMYTHTHAYIYIDIHIYIYICIYVQTNNLYKHMKIYMNICKHSIYANIYLYEYLHRYTNISIYIYTRIHKHIYIHWYRYTSLYIFAHIYIHIYTYTHTQPIPIRLSCVFFVFICLSFLVLYYVLFPTTHFSCQPRVSRNTLPTTCPQVSNCAMSNTIPFLVFTYVFFLLLCALFLTTHFVLFYRESAGTHSLSHARRSQTIHCAIRCHVFNCCQRP